MGFKDFDFVMNLYFVGYYFCIDTSIANFFL
jgi:hypothetical protein